MADEELMHQVAAGDRDALAELFRRHQKALYNFFLRGGAQPDDAEDLAMETLVRVYRGAPQFRGGSFRGWLYRLAVNAARDRARSRRRRPEVPASALESAWGEIEDGRDQDSS